MTRPLTFAYIYILLGIAVCFAAKITMPAAIEESEIIQAAAIVEPITIIAEPMIELEPEAASRYPDITESERDMIAALVYLEARGECIEGQQAVAEVVLNRVLSEYFPDTIEKVIYQENQFTPAQYIAITVPTQTQYDVVDAAMSGNSILPLEVIYFSTSAQNSRVWGAIENHVFCYA